METEDKARALFFRAQDARKAGRDAEAEALLREALLHSPGREAIRINLCGALIGQRKHAEALGLCEALAREFPPNAVTLHRLSLCQYETGAVQQALASIDQCLALTPDNADASTHKIAILLRQDDTDAALQAALAALMLAPQNAALHTAAGVIYTARREFDKTRECHRHALQLGADDNRRWNLALVQLMLGDLAQGWQNMEARWGNSEPVSVRYDGEAPRWDGKTSLRGRTILVWAEQGLGDNLQIARYLPRLAESATHIIFQAPVALAALMRSLPMPTDTTFSVIAEGWPLPPHDFNLPLWSLPACLPGADTIPGPIRLNPPAAHRELWHRRVGEGRRPRIGLMWQGNQDNLRGLNRTLAVQQLADIFALPFDFYCVSNTLSFGDGFWLREHAPSLKIFNRDIHDFCDTAALLQQLDLLISVDTSTAHLGPAVGIPTWVLLPWSADWRWAPSGPQTPWYPQSRLFRQQRAGEWDAPVRALREALVEHFR